MLRNITVFGSMSQTNEFDPYCWIFELSTQAIFCLNYNMVAYKQTFGGTTTSCYRTGLVPCPTNHTSSTGYYPNCCRYCKNDFIPIFDASFIF